MHECVSLSILVSYQYAPERAWDPGCASLDGGVIGQGNGGTRIKESQTNAPSSLFQASATATVVRLPVSRQARNDVESSHCIHDKAASVVSTWG